MHQDIIGLMGLLQSNGAMNNGQESTFNRIVSKEIIKETFVHGCPTLGHILALPLAWCDHSVFIWIGKKKNRLTFLKEDFGIKKVALHVWPNSECGPPFTSIISFVSSLSKHYIHSRIDLKITFIITFRNCHIVWLVKPVKYH